MAFNDVLLKRLTGQQQNGDAPQLPPFIHAILANFGITPDAIREYAETIKTAIITRLESIDARLGDIQDRLTILEQGQGNTIPAAPLPMEMAAREPQSWDEAMRQRGLMDEE